MRRHAGKLLAAALLVSTAVAGVAAVAISSIDPAMLRTRAIAGVQNATGRTFSAKSLSIRLLPELTIDAGRAELANPPGFSRPAMLTTGHARIRVAFLPLLRHRIIVREIILDDPDLLLERLPDGRRNWVFDPPARHDSRASASPQAHDQSRAILPKILGIVINRGSIGWRTPDSAGAMPITTARLREVNANSTIAVSLRTSIDDQPVSLDGRLGAQSRLWNQADHSPWPVALRLVRGAATIDANGFFTQPMAGRGYDFTVAAKLPDMDLPAHLWPNLPPLHDMVLNTHIQEQPNGRPTMAAIALTANGTDLSASVPGLALDRLLIDAPNLDGTGGTRTNRINLTGHYAGTPLSIGATLGPIGPLIDPMRMRIRHQAAQPPIPIDARLAAAGANLAVHGRLAPFGDLAGTSASVFAHIPDLAALTPLVRTRLPGLHDIDLSGTLRIAQLNLNALTPARPGSPVSLLIDLLRHTDADVALSVPHLAWHDTVIADIGAHLQLSNGRVLTDRLSGQLADGLVDGTFVLDVASDRPTAAFGLRAHGLDARKLSRLLGQPDKLNGTIDLHAALNASGTTLTGLAATLSGQAGASLTKARIDNAGLARAAALLIPSAGLGSIMSAHGDTQIDCLAVRFDLIGGVAALRAFLLDSHRFRLSATGTIDLKNQTLALRLRPYLRFGSSGIVLPSRADGSWRAPTLSPEPSGTAPGDAMLTLADTGDCAPALAASRDIGAPMPQPTPLPPALSRETPAALLLHQLFRP